MSFEQKHLDQLPEVLIDLVKSYVEPELQLAEVDIACVDPDPVSSKYLSMWFGGNIFKNGYIFSKKWTKIFDDGKVWICDPKKYTDNFNREEHVQEILSNLGHYNYKDECHWCNDLLSIHDKVIVTSIANHMNPGTQPDERLFCADCVLLFSHDEFLNTTTKTIKFYQAEDEKTIMKKELKVHISEPFNSPITACYALTEISGFNVTKYLFGNERSISSNFNRNRRNGLGSTKTTRTFRKKVNFFKYKLHKRGMSFEPEHLDQLPDVLIDLVKSYILPELRLAELGIACMDPDSICTNPRIENSIFCKKWVKTFDSEMWICDPKLVSTYLDEPDYVSCTKSELGKFRFSGACESCKIKLNFSNILFMRQLLKHKLMKGMVLMLCYYVRNVDPNARLQYHYTHVP